jgi:AraC-like DNA-binding protein
MLTSCGSCVYVMSIFHSPESCNSLVIAPRIPAGPVARGAPGIDIEYPFFVRLTMRKNTDLLSNRPDATEGVDVIADVLESVHLTTAIFGRLELGAPWRLRIPARDYLTFYVVARGGAWLELSDNSLPLSAGDAVLLPGMSAHVLRDANKTETPPTDFDYLGCPRLKAGLVGRLGGDGPVTSLIHGHFTLGSAHRNALIASLPPAIHLPAGATAASPQLSGVVSLIIGESASPGPGSDIVLARLADLLLVHSLRFWIGTEGSAACGLRAVADPAIGTALRLMHARPAESWTVERLASEVGASRSAFAARFAQLVGEPPLKYLSHWRMTTAARMLRETDDNVATIAERVGYANPVAFTKAFARLQGIGPGSYRRSQRRRPHPPARASRSARALREG